MAPDVGTALLGHLDDIVQHLRHLVMVEAIHWLYYRLLAHQLRVGPLALSENFAVIKDVL